jgi:hypothetical protein
VDLSENDLIRVTNIMGKQIAITGDNAADLTSQGRVDIVGQNGLQGQVNITAQPGALGQSVGGSVTISANGGVLGPLTFGGLVTIDANTGSIGSYGAATSAIKMSAAGINLYSGAIPSVGSLAGYSFIYSTLGTNICSGLPPLLPNIPLTTYVYGTAGVALEAGIGAEVEVKNSDFATLAIKPRTSAVVNFGDLVITGRPNIITPVQYVQLDMVKSITFDPATAATITNAASITSGVVNSTTITNSGVVSTPTLIGPAGVVDLSGNDISSADAIGCTSVQASGNVAAATLTSTAGNLQIFDPAPPGTLYGDVKYDSGTGRLAVLPQGINPEAVAYLSDIPTTYIAQYYNSAPQNLTSGNTNLSFDSTQAWNNDGGKITHTNGTTTFQVQDNGIYQLEFKTVVSTTGTTLSGTTNRNIAVDVTRGGTSSEIQTSAFTAPSLAYAQSVCGTVQLLAGDVLTLRLQCIFTGTAPQALGVLNVFDYNTAFTWTFVK